MSNLRADFDDQVLINDIASIAKNVSDELDILQGKKILFTGGAGFLGYEFLHLLAQVGDSDGRAMIDLTIYENFSRGRKPWLDHLSARQNVALEEHDITNPLPCDTPKFDYIVLFAPINLTSRLFELE